MARRQDPSSTLLYETAQRWADAHLRTDGSLFTPGSPVCTSPVLEELTTHFIDQPDLGAGSFIDKLRAQLAGVSAAAYQLMAELLFGHFLLTDKVTAFTKRKHVEAVLSWSPEPVVIPDEVAEAFAVGALNPGTFFNTRRDAQIAFLIRLMALWRSLEPSTRSAALVDPWALKEIVHKVPLHWAYQMREGLMYLLYPDEFERSAFGVHKDQIADRFHDLVTSGTDDVDRQLLEIRSALASDHGAEFDFYDPEMRVIWDPPAPSRWDEFIQWCARFRAWSGFKKEEIGYKLAVAEKLRDVRHAVEDEDDAWPELLKSAFHSVNLVPWQAYDDYWKWAKANRGDAAAALQALWAAPPGAPAVTAFLDLTPSDVVKSPGNRLAIASFLMATVDEREFPVYRWEPFHKAAELVEEEPPDAAPPGGPRYQATLDFLDRVIQEAALRDLVLADRLEAQAVVWCVTKWNPLDEWPEKDRKAFLAFRGDAAAEPEDEGPRPAEDPAPASTLGELAERLTLPVDFLEEVSLLLRTKGQVIFHGPPGTGKTRVALDLAAHLAEGDERVELVQFHPSYAYEDFVEGFRPSPDGSGFVLRPGPLKRLAEAAKKDPRPHVLVIDELNRGNLSSVLGELYFLLEYRDRPATLQYSDEPFRLPENLWLIGTMNTADRSIALIDAALRRRFFFIDFFPDQGALSSFLRTWLAGNRPEMSWVADVVERANEELGDRDIAIGHSHFLKSDLDDEWIERIWRHSILPYLAEQLFGQEGRLEAFTLDRLRGASSMPPVDAAPDVDATPDAPD